MAYIGPEPAVSFTSFATQEFSTSATTSYTLDHAVANENEIALFVNNVRQQPGSGKAYTASGTALTLSAATASTDTMYCVFLGRALQTVTPATNSITAAMVGNDLISGKDALTSTPADTDEFLISDGGILKRIDASLVGRGKVLQVVQTTKIDHFSTTNNYSNLTDVTGLNVAITPSSSSNKVFVMVQIMGSVSGTTQFIQLVRDSTNILIPSGGSFPATIANDSNNTYPGTINFLDSPSTTSEITYKIKTGAQSGTAHVNARQDDTTNHKFTSTITAMEISA